MLHARPTPPAARPRLPLRGHADASWRLLAPGDEVSVEGKAGFELIHLSEGLAWVSALADGTSRLVAVAALALVRPAGIGFARA